ncbi:hypothetical protein V6259_07310 [Marinomonas sp. TI.3.20]|uniref:hypothetical protein n=1 Tax=Marinomonas sp. TI.3.20 TaxID=3121296 RepID=UPI00311DAA3C
MIKAVKYYLMIVLFGYSHLASADTLLFVNTDNVKQRNEINAINNLIYSGDFVIKDDFFVIDIAKKKKKFHGEFRLIQDADGHYISNYLPTAIPEVFYVKNGYVMRRETLETFIAQHIVNQTGRE